MLSTLLAPTSSAARQCLPRICIGGCGVWQYTPSTPQDAELGWNGKLNRVQAAACFCTASCNGDGSQHASDSDILVHDDMKKVDK